MLSSINRSGNSNIIVSSLMTGQNGIKARGIARVFEATVGYEIQDESGNKLTNGSITAAAGGPNWGYFELVLNELPEDAAKLKLFQPSAMDGSKLDLVELKLK
ncbi:MAG: Spore germination protein-like protein Gmad2 [Desulfotomaculum sp. 46_296]|nr:MAG: Spore germination protein-like protein Gmad2 [Desulfotomaculum sp. 46_296]